MTTMAMAGAFDMGNYGPYVWSSFGLTALVVVVCVVQARRRHAAVIKDVTMRIRAMESDR